MLRHAQIHTKMRRLAAKSLLVALDRSGSEPLARHLITSQLVFYHGRRQQKSNNNKKCVGRSGDPSDVARLFSWTGPRGRQPRDHDQKHIKNAFSHLFVCLRVYSSSIRCAVRVGKSGYALWILISDFVPQGAINSLPHERASFAVFLSRRFPGIFPACV